MCVPCTAQCCVWFFVIFLWFCCCIKSEAVVLNFFAVYVNFKIEFFNGVLSNSVVKWHWQRERVKDSCIIYCWQQHVNRRTAQLSHISSEATCTADLDSGALALTNAQNRPTLLQLNRPLGTAVSKQPNFIKKEHCSQATSIEKVD